jgi:hypothetical protein
MLGAGRCPSCSTFSRPILPRAICASLQQRDQQVSGPRCWSRATQIEQSVALQTVSKGWVDVTSRPFSGLMTRASRSSLRRSRCSHTPRPRRPRRRGGVAGRDHWGFAGPGVEFAAVVHDDVQPAGEAVVGVRFLAAADADEWLDVLGPAPPSFGPSRMTSLTKSIQRINMAINVKDEYGSRLAGVSTAVRAHRYR